MNNNYFYPLFDSWTEDELRQVCRLYMLVEHAYEDEQGVKADQLVTAFKKFKMINPAKGEQKQLERAFLKRSGYNIYKAVQYAKQRIGKKVKMK